MNHCQTACLLILSACVLLFFRSSASPDPCRDTQIHPLQLYTQASNIILKPYGKEITWDFKSKVHLSLLAPLLADTT